MKLIPYFWKQKNQSKFRFTSLSVFMSHAGKSIWCSDESGTLSKQTILEDYCEPNGFVVKSIHLDKDTAYIEVDAEKMNLSDFYTWEEALQKPGKPECWRSFYFVQDKEGCDWWSPKGLIEAEIQGYGNAYDLWRHLRTVS
jgi:hypothetical protein